MFAHDAELSAAVIDVAQVCGRPLWAKLSPNTDRVVEVAGAVHQAGAEAVTLVNTLFGMVLDPKTLVPALGVGGGGLSGQGIHPVAVRIVHDVRAAHPQLPIVGCGGVSTRLGRDRAPAGGRHGGRCRHGDVRRSACGGAHRSRDGRVGGRARPRHARRAVGRGRRRQISTLSSTRSPDVTSGIDASVRDRRAAHGYGDRMATPPVLTPEQRAAALAKAAEARTARAELKTRLKMGSLTLAEALASTDSTVGKLKVVSLLESLPGVGKVKARKIMEDIGIADNRRVQGLGAQQKASLLDQLGK